MISKELLSEVLNKDVISFDFSMYGNINYKVNNDYGSSINIYELAHKCKEWAKSKKYELVSYPSILWKNYQCVAIDNEGNRTEPFRADTEVKAIIEACQWILDSKVSK